MAIHVWGWSVFNGQHSVKAPTKSFSNKCSSTAFSRSLSWKKYSSSILPSVKESSLVVPFVGYSSSTRSNFVQKKEGIVKVLSPKIASSILSPSLINIELLDGMDDEYNGFIIDPQSLPLIPNAFASSLRASLSNWKLKGKKGIWLKILQEQSHLVPIAIQEGFNYHHAEPGYVMLTHWIANEPCTLPASPSHQVGIAAFVINHKREILAVKEKCPCSCSGVWKLPTGYIDKSEEIFTGAVREVKEETGVETSFLEMVAFRHAQFVAFEKSDLMFVCILKPLSFEITVDQKEIQDAKWITLDELVGQPFYVEDPMSKKVIKICMATYESRYNGFIAHQLTSKFDGKLSYLYYNNLKNL